MSEKGALGMRAAAVAGLASALLAWSGCEMFLPGAMVRPDGGDFSSGSTNTITNNDGNPFSPPSPLATSTSSAPPNGPGYSSAATARFPLGPAPAPAPTPVPSDFIPYPVEGAGDWTAFEKSACSGIAAGWPSSGTLLVELPIIPGHSGANLTGAAEGLYQNHYALVARCLAQSGHGGAIIRIGLNDAVRPEQAGFAVNYRAAFRNIVHAFREVSPNFRFDWIAKSDKILPDPDQDDAYPGDDVVDFIGLRTSPD